MGVKCKQGCKFQIKPSLSKETEVEDGVEMQMDFLALESKVFKFYIPSTSAAKDAQNRINSVTVTAAPYLQADDQISLAVNTHGGDVNPSRIQLKGVAGWRKGQTFRLSEQNREDWCTDCWMYMLVDVTNAGKYHLMVKTNVGLQQLHQSKPVDDVAFAGERTCYKYYVQAEDADVKVRMAKYSGMLSYTVNPRKMPVDYEAAAFRNTGA